MKEELIKRIKGFGWGALGAGLFAVLTFVSGNLDLIEMTNLSSEIKIFLIGAITALINQITKYLNSKFQLEERTVGALKKLAGK